MKKSHSLLICVFTVLFTSSTISQLNKIESISKLKHVTIYNNGAFIERTGSITLNQGSNDQLHDRILYLLSYYQIFYCLLLDTI